MGNAANKPAAAVWCYLINMDQNLMNISSPLFQNLKQFWSQNEVQSGASEVYLLKWPMSAFLVSLSITGVINNNEIQQENKSTNKEQHQMQNKRLFVPKIM